jgi:hypothetical protein
MVEGTTMVITSSQQNTRLYHAGPQLMTASLNERYGISRIRNLVKAVIACYKFKVQASQQLLGELPSARVQPWRLDLTTGADYAGPVALRLVTIRSKKIPRVILLFFVTTAIHIEVKSLTTEAFLAALRRFIARRGKPKTLYSYDVTNFKVHLLNSMKYTTCINLHHKWQDYMIFWQLNDVT